jgi:hypothetical protein
MAAEALTRYLPAWLFPERRRRAERMLEALREQISRDHKNLVRELREIKRTAEQHQARIDHALATHERALALLPELQASVDRCVAAYMSDSRTAARINDFHVNVDRDAVLAHARQTVGRAQLQTDPCPHILLERVFPDDVYDRLVEALPSPVFFEKVSEHRDEMPVPLTFAPAYSRLAWRLFHDAIEEALLPAVIEKFRPALDAFVRETWPSLESWDRAGITLRAANPRLMLRRRGYVIKPHRDPRWAFLVALFYFAPRGSSHTYGTQLYRLKVERDEAHTSPMWLEPDEVELVKDVPGIGNSAVIFLNSTGAHGASIPDDAPADFLRYFYQARFSPDTTTKNRLLESTEAGRRDRWVATR